MRLFIFCLLILIALNVPFFVFFVCAFLYALWRPAYELIVLGICIDALFGGAISVHGFLYTVSLGVLVLGAEVLKPHVSFYNTKQ